VIQSGRRRLTRLIPFAFVVAAVSAAAYAIARDATAVASSLGRVGVVDLMLSLAFAIAALLAIFLMWRCLLVDVGIRRPAADMARMFFVAQLGKYLPGSVWPVLAQLEYGRRAGLDRKAVLAANLLALTHGLGTGLLAGLALVVMGAPTLAAEYWWASAGVPVALCLLHPRLVPMLLNFVLRRLGRSKLERGLSWGASTKAALYGFLAWMLFGGHMVVLVGSMGTVGVREASLTMGGFALATCAGIIFVPAPAGVGVRDGVLVAALSAAGDLSQALSAALMSRVVLILADLALASMAAWRHSWKST